MVIQAQLGCAVVFCCTTVTQHARCQGLALVTGYHWWPVLSQQLSGISINFLLSLQVAQGYGYLCLPTCACSHYYIGLIVTNMGKVLILTRLAGLLVWYPCGQDLWEWAIALYGKGTCPFRKISVDVNNHVTC